MFKVNNNHEVVLGSGVFIVNFENISHLIYCFKCCSSVSIINFKHVIDGWEMFIFFVVFKLISGQFSISIPPENIPPRKQRAWK